MKLAASKSNGNNTRRKLLWTRMQRQRGLVSTPRQGEIDHLSEQIHQLTARLAECEEAMSRARLQALIDSQCKSDLLARVNHDLRQPLGAILGFAEMLRDGIFGPVTDTQQQVLGEIINSNERLSQMVTDLLDAARLDAQDLRLRIEPISPEHILRQVCAQMNPQAERKGLTLQTDLDPWLAQNLPGDANRITQILVHLVVNAIKFTRQGHVSIRAYTQDAGHWALSVADTGCGIPAEALNRIFEPFNQVNDPAARDTAELGLGLSIVQQLVQLMGGQIRVDSTVGVGSTFTVILPFDPGAMKGE